MEPRNGPGNQHAPHTQLSGPLIDLASPCQQRRKVTWFLLRQSVFDQREELSLLSTTVPLEFAPELS
jgi:hypothetical protein